MPAVAIKQWPSFCAAPTDLVLTFMYLPNHCIIFMLSISLSIMTSLKLHNSMKSFGSHLERSATTSTAIQ